MTLPLAAKKSAGAICKSQTDVLQSPSPNFDGTLQFFDAEDDRPPHNGKYYGFEGKLYLTKGNLEPCVWNPGTAGMWQWELVG